MGDRPYSNPRGGKANGIEEIHFLLDQAINLGELRDEIYVQVCKQLTKNPNPYEQARGGVVPGSLYSRGLIHFFFSCTSESVSKGWELMAVMSNTFPPSKNFEDYLKDFIGKQQAGGAADPRIQAMAKYCQTKLGRICKIGSRGKTPSFAEIERARVPPD
jgi:hypothetical protein